MLNPRLDWSVLLLINVRSVVPCRTVALALAVDDLITMHMPTWLAAHAHGCHTLPSTRTRCAFLSSNPFFTLHRPFHASGLEKWLRRIVISLGRNVESAGSAPPNMTFSPAPSR